MKRILSFALAMILVLTLTACGGQFTAATMHLRRTEGTVSVSDGSGKDIPALNNLGLYSGYGVGTGSVTLKNRLPELSSMSRALPSF